MLHARMNLIDASGIRKVFDLAAKLENPINLSIGLPDFDTPDEIKEAAIDAIRRGRNRYTVTQGTEELRDGVREHLKKTRGVDYSRDQILITSGVSGGILLSFMALFGRGDQLIVPDPYFVMYKHLLRILGGEPIYADTYPDFQLTAQRIRPLISGKTKALIAGSPSNPTGAVIPGESWKEIVKVCEDRDLLLVSDEIYDGFVYTDDYVSPASLSEKVLLLGGFSKTHAMTGWRLGYAAGPKELIQAMTTLQQFTFVCAPSMVQEAGLAALQVSMEEKRNEYRRKRDKLVDGLKGYYEIAGGDGAFYLYPYAPGGNATEFCERAIREKQLLIIPGQVFSERDNHFRISFAADDRTLDRGIQALRELARK